MENRHRDNIGQRPVAEQSNPAEKSLLEISQDLSVLVKSTVIRFTQSFWDKVPLKWHEKLKLCLKTSLIVFFVVIVFLIGWYASRNSYYTADSDNNDLTSSYVYEGEDCIHNRDDPEDCSQFYFCNSGTLEHRHCPKFHHFDTVKLECLWIHQANCGSKSGDDDTSLDTDTTTTDADGIPSLKKVLDDEVKLTSSDKINLIKARLVTLPSEEVELVQPGRSDNPSNTKLVESIITSEDWEFLFPARHKSYSYTNFLRAIAKFPAVCYSSNPDICRKVLATMFAHFTQETGAHNPSLQVPEWRQGLAYVEEVGCDARDCGYSANCATNQWTTKAWPCGKDSKGKFMSYHGRGAKQLSYNYNYGQFSSAMYDGDARYLLDRPELVADTWLNFASAVWFFATPQPPKPSMLGVVEGDWKPNQADLRAGLVSGFGLTTNIINGGIECGKGLETAQARNRVDYYRKFAQFLGVEIDNQLGCGRMKQFGASGASAGAVATYWEQDWSEKFKCKLVSYQTPFSALVKGEYVKCVEQKFKIKL